jgi:glycosyltransferase involved in cell wall biosynthesis
MYLKIQEDRKSPKTGRLKILLGVHQFFPEHQTGTEVLTLELARGLRIHNHTVHILACIMEHTAPYKAKPWLTHDEYDGFPVHTLHYGVGNWNKIAFLELFNPDRIALVKDLVSTITPDIVHLNHLIGFTGGIIPVIRDMGIPVVFAATDFWTVCPAYTLYKRFEKKVCELPVNPVECLKCLMPIPEWAAKIAFHMGKIPLHTISTKGLALHELSHRSQFMAEYINRANAVFVSTGFLASILTKGGIDRQKINVIPYGVDIGDLPEQLPISNEFTEKNPLRLGFIGTLSEKKGAHVVFDALTCLDDVMETKSSNFPAIEKEGMKAIPPSSSPLTKCIELLVYGDMKEGDPYCNMLLEKAKTCGSIVRFMGTFPHEGIGEILRGMHILAVPSVWYESSPLVLTSALNAHVPLIVSDLGGLTEMINGENYGLSYPAGDPGRLAGAISRTIVNPELIVKMRQNMKNLKRSTLDYAEEVESEYFKMLS